MITKGYERLIKEVIRMKELGLNTEVTAKKLNVSGRFVTKVWYQHLNNKLLEKDKTKESEEVQ